ncbi:uncharacterized protein LOC134255441 [Saccostrea cucullata]|uniref:uncharacterized protein LOC134255441 n=1 Tax=Saccostrea cuccullata TaxID=36930 RepID=UPI002ED48D7F
MPLQIDIWGEYMSFRSFCFVLGILGSLLLIILIVLLLVYKILRGQKTELQTHKPAVSKPIHEGNLEDSLCIVSFDESSSRTNHLSMTKTIAEYGELKLQTKRVVVKKNSLDDLKDSIPPSKVFLVYIDYNEGNVILDKSETGTRRQTVKYLMKTNALVFIVYCLEKSSENLEELYAQKLTTIKTDPVLVDLSKRDRVFSIYKTFSKKQMEVIVKGIYEFTKQSV